MSLHRGIFGTSLLVAWVAGCEAQRVVSAPIPIPTDAVALSLPASRAAAFDSSLRSFRFYSGLALRDRLVITSAAEWNEVWSRLTALVQPRPAAPEVDFTKEMVILAAMGSRSSGGYSIGIDGVFEHEGEVFVSVHEASPGRRCMVTAAFTAPVAAVIAPRRTGRAHFSEVAVTRDC